MAGLPGISINRSNQGVSPVAPTPNVALVVGPCSLGTIDNVYTFGGNPAAVQSTLGFGPAPTLAEMMLADGAQSVYVIPASASIAASSTPMLSSSGPAITYSGTPNDSFQFLLEVLTVGALGTSTFQFSLDDGQTFSPPLATTGSYVVPNTGLTLAMSAGTYQVGATYAFNTVAPRMIASDFTNAVNAFTGSNVVPLLVACANHTTASLEGLALARAMDAALITLNKYEKPTVGVVPTGGIDGQAADVISAFNTFASSGPPNSTAVECVAERARRQVPLGFMGYGNPLLPFAFAVADALQQNVASTNPARVANGGLTGVNLPTYDEFVNGSVYLPAGLGAPRTFQGLPGVFLNQDVLKSQPGSSFIHAGDLTVYNLAQAVVDQGLKKYINSKVRVVPDGTGRIDKRDATRINNDINKLLTAAIMQPTNAEGTKGLASAVQFAVDQTTNVLETGILNSTTTLVPLANLSNIVVNLTFSDSTAVTT